MQDKREHIPAQDGGGTKVVSQSNVLPEEQSIIADSKGKGCKGTARSFFLGYRQPRLMHMCGGEENGGATR